MNAEFEKAYKEYTGQCWAEGEEKRNASVVSFRYADGTIYQITEKDVIGWVSANLYVLSNGEFMGDVPYINSRLVK
jgi:hypothetical protein